MDRFTENVFVLYIILNRKGIKLFHHLPNNGIKKRQEPTYKDKLYYTAAAAHILV